MTNEDRNKSPQSLQEAFRLITKLHARVNTLETQLGNLTTLCSQVLEYSSIIEEVEDQLGGTDNNEVVVGSTGWDVPEHQIIPSSTPDTPPY